MASLYLLSETKDCSECPPPWVNFDDHCYLFVDIMTNFTEAEIFCQTLSDCDRPCHLASIHSVEEHSFVADKMTELWSNDPIDLQVWIGRTQPGDSAAEWTDETSTTFDLSYPSTVDSSSTWFDTFCYQELRFVCKK
ncbi:Snaclec agkicetin-C subunit beta [Holothuria leucospilota]|uniref:Snaclec agkicetin-C subunit beta n=1 Tax=Holothuria leucospilota TaxID=206669 RepID=A0A9Q1BDP3_HOLLE|nr:Snaclec agkicetin-C subunit beta [Holothuria leucospilota]